MLTPKQKELLMFIHQRVSDTGVPPSFDEMKVALDLKSKSGIHRLITALEERGFIRRLPHRARALEILKLPDVARSAGGPVPGGFQPTIVGGTDTLANVQPTEPEPASSMSVPLMGRIAAGVPITAIENHDSDVTVPADMLRGGEHFALEVHGDSMVDLGIHEGDIAVIRKTATADSGDIVVAIVDNSEATLKTLRKHGSTVALEAANPSYETRSFDAGRVSVQGRLVGLMRRY